MNHHPICTKQEHDQAVARIAQLIDANPQPGSPEGKELDALAALVDAYEAKNFPIDPPDPEYVNLFRVEHVKPNS